MNWDAFKWRNHQPDIGRFFNIDPLADKYVYNSPYAFSENRVINGRELEGLEVVLVNENKTKDKPIAEAAKKNTDQSAVHVYGHGNPKNMLGKDGWVETPKQFDKMLKADEKWANRKEGEAITVVLHSCRTGRTTTDKNGKEVESFAQKMSAAFPGVTIIAPDERDVFFSDPNEAGSAREGGPMQAKYSDENGDYTKEDKNGDHNKELSGEMGNWNVFQGGKQTGQYDGNWTPTASPSWLDNLLYKKK